MRQNVTADDSKDSPVIIAATRRKRAQYYSLSCSVRWLGQNPGALMRRLYSTKETRKSGAYNTLISFSPLDTILPCSTRKYFYTISLRPLQHCFGRGIWTRSLNILLLQKKLISKLIKINFMFIVSRRRSAAPFQNEPVTVLIHSRTGMRFVAI